MTDLAEQTESLARVVKMSNGYLCLILGSAVATDAADKLVNALIRMGAKTVEVRRDAFIERDTAVTMAAFHLGPRDRWGGLV